MNFLQFLRILVARRSIFFAALLSCFVVATLAIQILPERYKARTRVMLDTIKPDPVTGQVMANQSLRSYTRTQTELIRDYQIAGPVVDQLGWASNPELVAQYQAATNGKGDDIRRWLAQQIIDNTDANLIEASNILEITFNGSSPEAAKRIATMIRDAYIDASLDYRRQSAGKTADWYRDQTDKARALVTTAETARSQFAKEHGVVLQADSVDLESARLAALSSQTVAAVGQTAAPAFVGGGNAAPPAASTQLVQLNQQIAQAALTLGPNHPALQTLVRQRAVLQAEESRQRAGSVPLPRMAGGVSSAQVDAAYERQKAKVIAQRDTIDQLNQMTRDIAVKRDQYTQAAQRAGQLRLEANVGETGLTPMGSAVVSNKATYPNIPLILFASIGFGSALGVCLSLLIELLGRKVRSDDDLEYAAKAPVFALIGQAENPDSWHRRMARKFVDWRAERQARRAEV
jgi:polysaccharide biosynthesis transport protein